MPQHTHATIKATAAVAVAVLVAAGCGSSSTPTVSPAVTTAAGGATSGTTTGSGTTQGGNVPGGSATVQGITATTITLGQLADVSGPVPGLFTGAVDGMDAWAAMVNASGGIDGRKIVIDHKDAQLACNTYTTDYKSLSTSVFANVGTYSLVDGCGASTNKTTPTFPDIEGAVLDPSIAASPNVYGAIPAANGYPTTGYQWVKDTYGLAAVQHTADLWGSTEQFDFTIQEAAASSIGFKYVYNRGYSPTETNYTSDILRMKSDGVKVVDIIDMNTQDVALFLQQASQQNFHPDAVINTSAYDPTFFKLLGNASAAAPMVWPLPYALYLGQDAASVPEITTMTNWLNKTHPGDPMNLFVMESFAAGLLFQQAMTTLGANPTQAGLLSTLGGITNFTADGLLAPSNVGQKKGVTCDAIVRAKNGQFTRVTPATGFECKGTFVYAKASS